MDPINMVRTSIIIPAFNAAEYLPRCIESIIGQSEESIQIVVVNDGSTDRTLEIARSYARTDPRVSVINQLNKGVSAARNRGMAVATGDYICFIDSDDWADPEMVRTMVSWCEATNAEVAVAGAIFDYHDNNEGIVHSTVHGQIEYVARSDVPLPADIVDEEFINLIGFPWNKMYQREWLIESKEKFEEGLHLYEDVDFNVRVLSKAKRIAFVPQAFVHYVQRPRASLVTIRDSNFLSVSLRAIQNFDFILEKWGVGTDVRKARVAQACAGALWASLNGAAANRKPRTFLIQLLRSPGADEIIQSAVAGRPVKWRNKWATFTIHRGLYRTGLLAVAILQPIKKYRAHVFKLLHR